MTRSRSIVFGAVILGLGLLIWALGDVLTPFVLGLAIAYLFDPIVDRLQRLKLGRGMATLIVLLGFFVLMVLVALTLFPLLQAQAAEFIERLPGYIRAVQERLLPVFESAFRRATRSEGINVQEAVGAYVGDAVMWFGRAITQLWAGGVALFNVLSVMFITPLVAFFLLRDWDDLRSAVLQNIPPGIRPAVVEQASEIDRTLAGFVRGQSLVCLALALIYGGGLTLVGLELGFVIGVSAGVLSFVPYLGALVGVVFATAVGAAQFGFDWQLASVLAVFLVGQVIESFWLTPQLVGERVRLHPVWVLFALTAGGALAGFAGVLLAVPVAAAAGVLLRHGFKRYRSSTLFLGGR